VIYINIMKNIKKMCEDFEQYLLDNKKSNNTIIAYKKDIKQFLNFLVSKKYSINEEKSINLFLDYLKVDLSLTNKTLSRKLNAIKTFYKYLFNNNHIKCNPSLNLRGIKTIPSRIVYLSRQDCFKIRSYLEKNPKLKVIVELMLQTGVLISETCNIKAKEVNFDEGYLIVNKRKIPLNAKIKSLLYMYIKENKIKSYEYIFQTRNKTQIKPRNLRTQITKAISECKMKYTVNHLRNTFIINQLLNNVDKSFLAIVLGFKTIRSLIRYENSIGLVGKKSKEKNKVIYEI